MKPHRTEGARKKADPVLPDQGGRSMPVDPPPIQAVREETIAARAHELWEQRGRKEGHALEDWLAAESQITGAH